MPGKVLIVDDHPIIRDALVTSLISLGIFDRVETAASFQELLEKLERDDDYQLLVLDLSLTDVSGADGMLYIREHYPALPVVIFSGNDGVDIIAQCFENGVHGFVSKNSPMQVFVSAIRIVLAGSTYIPPSAASLMGFESNQVADAELLPTQEQVRFTPKQKEVFEQLIQGVPNKVIARRLNMAEGTVKTHLHGIYQLLRVGNRAQAILRSQQLQIIK